MKTFDFVEKDKLVLSVKKWNKTLALAALSGFLTSFLLLERKTNFSYSFTGPFDQFFTWLNHAHSNTHVVYITPILFVLLAMLVRSFIDYAKEEPKSEPVEIANT